MTLPVASAAAAIGLDAADSRGPWCPTTGCSGGWVAVTGWRPASRIELVSSIWRVLAELGGGIIARREAAPANAPTRLPALRSPEELAAHYPALKE